MSSDQTKIKEDILASLPQYLKSNYKDIEILQFKANIQKKAQDDIINNPKNVDEEDKQDLIDQVDNDKLKTNDDDSTTSLYSELILAAQSLITNKSYQIYVKARTQDKVQDVEINKICAILNQANGLFSRNVPDLTFNLDSHTYYFFESSNLQHLPQNSFSLFLTNIEQCVLGLNYILKQSEKIIIATSIGDILSEFEKFLVKNISNSQDINKANTSNIKFIDTAFILSHLSLKVQRKDSAISKSSSDQQFQNTVVETFQLIKSWVQNVSTKALQMQFLKGSKQPEIIEKIQLKIQKCATIEGIAKVLRKIQEELNEQSSPDISTQEDSGDQDLLAIFSSLNINGFNGQLFLQHQNQMIESLQLHKYTLSQLIKEKSFTIDKKQRFLREVAEVVKKYICRCVFDLYHHSLINQRQHLLEDSDLQQYKENVQTYIETQKWVVQEMSAKAKEMLELDQHFKEKIFLEIINGSSKCSGIFSIQQFEKGDGYLSVVNKEVYETMKNELEWLQEQSVSEPDQQIDRKTLKLIVRQFKLSIAKLFENSTIQNKSIEDNILEDSILIEDEICFIFGVSRFQLLQAIINHNYEAEFYI
eukprot:403370893